MPHSGSILASGVVQAYEFQSKIHIFSRYLVNMYYPPWVSSMLFAWTALVTLTGCIGQQRWFVGIFNPNTTSENLTAKCISSEDPDGTHPSDASWVCELSWVCEFERMSRSKPVLRLLRLLIILKKVCVLSIRALAIHVSWVRLAPHTRTTRFEGASFRCQTVNVRLTDILVVSPQ